jgi:hypothetical protein
VTGAGGPALPSDGVLADVYRAADGPARSALREAIAGIAQLADTSIADLETVTRWASTGSTSSSMTSAARSDSSSPPPVPSECRR